MPKCGPRSGKRSWRRRICSYYVQRVWGPLFYRKVVSDQVFARIPTIYLPDRPPLPGDYFVTQAGAIDQFMIRMKHSLRDAREMLSNTVAFWMVQELANKNWDPGRGRHSRPDHGLSRPASRAIPR